jgi:hypothetical protein
MRHWIVIGFLVGIPPGGPAPARAADEPIACPMHAAHQASADAAKGHHDAVDQRHDDATGVSHADSVHHFRIEPRGGTIRLEVTDPKDTAGRDRIRLHLAKVVADFTEGRFELPMRIHEQVPPGVDTMRRLGGAIRYRYAATSRGGRVEITTDNAEARAAVHEFLRFQIDEHRTGDPASRP